MAVYLMCSKHQTSPLFDPVIKRPGIYTLGMIVHIGEAVFVSHDCISKNNGSKNKHPHYPSVRNCFSKFCASVKFCSRLLEFCGENLYLLTWKDAHDRLLSEKYSISYTIPVMCNYIHISPFL